MTKHPSQADIDSVMPFSQGDLATRTAVVIEEAKRITQLLFGLLEELSAARSDGDEWTRLPRPKERCPVSKFSRSKINDLIAKDLIRKKTAQGGTYYSLADVRALIRNTAPSN